MPIPKPQNAKLPLQDEFIVDVDKKHDSMKGGELARTMGLWTSMGLIIGFIIGSGSFVLPANVLELVGSPGAALSTWILGGVVAFSGAMSYVEWATMLPVSGGDMPYLEYTFRKPYKFWSFLYCWCRCAVVHPGHAAALASICGNFALIPFNPPDSVVTNWMRKCIGTVVLTVVLWLCSYSTDASNKIGTTITVIKSLNLFFVGVTGIGILMGIGNRTPTGNFFPENFWSNTSTDPSRYASALYKVFFCYEGWGNLATVVGEMKDPLRNVPRASIGGVGIVTALYTMANLSYLAVLPYVVIMEIAANPNVIIGAVWGNTVYGKLFGTILLPCFIFTSAFGACLARVFSASRVIFAAARHDYFPGSDWLGKLNTLYLTPVNALLANHVLSLLFLILPPNSDVFAFLIDLTSWPIWLFYAITMYGLLHLRRKEPERERPFRVWTICPIIVIVCGLFLCVFPFFSPSFLPRLSAGLGLLFTALGVVPYYTHIYRKQVASPKKY
ncbi:amino acid/polyamine transporter I [Paraphysoderma sedebokerense]|nr:amino acid/polyamine transporter I [Paraphysoderma sedebokerense]